jgi:quercetin dioxygenase-like cupin family protein
MTVEREFVEADLPDGVQLIRWPHPTRRLPEDEVSRFFDARGVHYSRWSNGPNEIYSVHTHPYRKTLFCMTGSIAFALPDAGRSVELHHGDRLILPPGMRHGAVVGPEGVTCIEAGE